MNRVAWRGSVGLVAIVSAGVLAWAGQALAQSATDLPERSRKQVSPGPATPWRPPDLRGYSNALTPTEHAPIDPTREYGADRRRAARESGDSYRMGARAPGACRRWPCRERVF